MPSALTVLASLAGATLLFVYLAWTEISNVYPIWDELEYTPWTETDQWQRQLDTLRGKIQMTNIALTAAFVASAAVALLSCTLRTHLTRPLPP